MKIKEMEQLTGISVKNIRFYEEQGLLSPDRDRQNGYRSYGDGDLRALKIIKVLRKLDMPVESIREVLAQEQPLAEAAARHSQYLEGSIRELQSAQALCRELADAAPTLQTLDVDNYLSRMDAMEQQDGSFASIVDDFKLVAAAIEKMRFHFYPDELITTPAEFTDALFKYATEQKLEITMTKESMYPEFVLDGIEYSAMRTTSRFGSVISVEAKDAEGLMPRHVPRQRRWWMEWMWRMGLPVAVVAGIAILFMGGASGTQTFWVAMAVVGVYSVLLLTFYNIKP